MKVGVPKELVPGEHRVALIPETVGRLGDGVEVLVEAGAGEAAGFSDEAYRDAGATIGDPWGADVIAKVAAPTRRGGCAAARRAGADRVSAAADRRAGIERLAAAGVHAFALESIPRTTRAQPMDALSSQATVAGYKAVLIAADRLPRFFPMLMTAAGTIPPAKVLVLGAGVAGLQAIATARRLGAVVSGVRRAPGGARAGRVARRDVPRSRRCRRGDRGRLRARADRRSSRPRSRRSCRRGSRSSTS